MRISTTAIIILIIALTLFAGFTVYGNKVGNFVVNIKNEEINLALSVEEDLSVQKRRLTFDGNSALSDNSYGFLPEDIVAGGLGNISNKGTYSAFGFYVINNSERAVDYVMDLKIKGVVGDPLPIIRIMLIEGENGTFNTSNRIFALAEASRSAEEHLERQLRDIRYYKSEPFDIENDRIFMIKIRDVEQGGKRRYTLVMWIEGCDIECVDSRIGSRLKLQLDITGY